MELEKSILEKPNIKMTKNKIILPPDDCYGEVFGIVQILGNTYVCPGWHPVPNGTTRDQIQFDISIQPLKTVSTVEVTPEPEKTQDVTHLVTSSNGKTQYSVEFRRGSWSCTCPAANFRRGDCKHIKMFK
jgi:hypothetical protein